MGAIEAFLREVDAAWRQPGPRIRLRIIGSTALMLLTNYHRGTKDSDVLETDEVTNAVAERLLHIAGPGTEIHTRRAMYIDIVRRGVPFRRQSPAYHRLDELSASLEHFDVEVMSLLLSRLPGPTKNTGRSRCLTSGPRTRWPSRFRRLGPKDARAVTLREGSKNQALRARSGHPWFRDRPAIGAILL